jgi:hypothetical protein
MKTLLSALLLLVLATSVAYAEAEEVYRTVKPDGTVVYSDRPISADSVLVQVQSRPTSEARAAAEAGAANAFAAQPAAPGDDEALAAALRAAARWRAPLPHRRGNRAGAPGSAPGRRGLLRA